MSSKAITELREEALRFLRSRDPIVILEVPGCQARGVNPAHHPRLDCPTIRTVEEYLDTIRKCAQASHAENEANFHACYCLREEHILALRFEDCVYEDRYLVFQRFGRRVLPGLEFTHSGTAGGVRTYRISRVHAKVHFPPAPRGSIRGVLEARLVESDSLELTIAGDARKGVMTGTVCVKARERQQVVEVSGKLDMASQALDLYRKLDLALLSVKDRPIGFVRTELDDFLSSVEPGAYALVRDIVEDVKGNPSKIEGYLTRIWDAPFVSREVRIPLEGWLAGVDPEWLDSLPRKVAASINRLTLPITELEALDALRDFARSA